MARTAAGGSRTPRRRGRGGTLAIALLAATLGAGGAAPDAAERPRAPPLAPEAIEADWERQEALRERALAGAAAGRRRRSHGVTPAEDAAGGCDGLKDGKWGFHTAQEPEPWWQVDLGRPRPLEEVLVYNRCDPGMAERASRLQVRLSLDGEAYEKVYEHDGTVFYGHRDGKPLAVSLGGRRARFVRLQLPGTSYFHLDEVEVRAAGGGENVALGRPATQSSTSQWSVRHGPAARSAAGAFTRRVIRRGLELAENLRALGADVEAERAALRRHLAELDAPEAAGSEARRRLDRQVRWLVRRLALANPLLDFDEILFVKRAPGLFPHVCDQYYGWWSRPGGGLYVLSGFRGDAPRVRCLTDGWPAGSFLRPDVSGDGSKVLFSWCRHHEHVAAMEKTDKEKLPEDAFYHLFEMDLRDGTVRQLTRGRYDDFDGRYLPSGDIVFLSTRRGRALQVSRASTAATLECTSPDSYVRCGGDDRRPVAVFTLHVLERRGGDGGLLCPISAFENFEWTPAVAADGTILYARWDYIDRFNGHFMSLWSTRPDGTQAQLVYGNYTPRPQCVFEARPVPGSRKLVFTATAHHSITGGSLVLFERGRGTEGEEPLERLTPEVVFPETEGWPASYYASPYPLSEEHFLVAWSDRPLPPHRLMAPDDPANPPAALGLYLYDAFGNLTLLYRDPEISSTTPIPLRPRPRPPVLPAATTAAGEEATAGAPEGRFLLLDVYRGLEGIPRGSVRRLQIVGVPPKVQPHMNRPVLGVSQEDPGKFVLGTVPVETDGSAYFRVPAGTPLFFQALDERGLALATMRSLTYVQPGETASCAGCHESRDMAPASGALPRAAWREPSRIVPGPEGSWPLRFEWLVQPVLETRCLPCHRPGAPDPGAAAFDLTFPASYGRLLEWAEGDLRRLVFERDRSQPGECPARRSRLLELVLEGHEGVRLGEGELERLVTWMDTYAQRLGSFSEEQEEDLRALGRRLSGLLEPRP